MKEFRKRLSFNLFLSSIDGIYRNYFETKRSKFGYIDPSARIRYPFLIKGIENTFIYENSHILGYAKIITTKAKFIMKKNSAAAEGLTVVTGNHPIIFGELFLEKAGYEDVQNAKDVIIEEDVWIAVNVTLLAGVIIGRGAILGAGTVCRKSVPPYSIVIGNPASVIGFKFKPEEIIKHEMGLYPEDSRLPI